MMALQREVRLLPSAFFNRKLKAAKAGASNVRLVLFNTPCNGYHFLFHQGAQIFHSRPVQAKTLTFQFQQDMQASLIRFLRERIAEQRDVLLRVKHEREELKNLRKCVSSLVFLSWLIVASKGWSRSFGQRTNNCDYMRV